MQENFMESDCEVPTASAGKLKCILISGPPGVGKTTMVRNVCSVLKSRNIVFSGFITEEVRAGGERIGFDVATISRRSQRVPLARKLIQENQSTGPTTYVGPYTVFVKTFEDFVVPIIEKSSIKRGQVMIIDEIGKMELKSYRFAEALKFASENSPILATVPFHTKFVMPIVEELRQSPNTKVISLNRFNRTQAWNQLIVHLDELLS